MRTPCFHATNVKRQDTPHTLRCGEVYWNLSVITDGKAKLWRYDKLSDSIKSATIDVRDLRRFDKA